MKLIQLKVKFIIVLHPKDIFEDQKVRAINILWKDFKQKIVSKNPMDYESFLIIGSHLYYNYCCDSGFGILFWFF